jgi:hypothetical protein
MSWLITNCYIEGSSSGFAMCASNSANAICMANTAINPVSNYENYHLITMRSSLVVGNGHIEATPEIQKDLMEIHTHQILNSCHLKISNSIRMEENKLIIPLGDLIICFDQSNPCPTFFWQGGDCPQIDKLFKRFNNLKAFW